jgi:GntR family transcriptional regulator
MEMHTMYLTMSVDPHDATPIWKQIEERIRRLVASRGLQPGSPIPSVRDLARELRINPATVVRAYQRLTEDGVLTVRRGEGTFVADAPPAMAKVEKTRLLREGALRYVSLAATMGATGAEVVGEVEDAWQSLGRAPRGVGR